MRQFLHFVSNDFNVRHFSSRCQKRSYCSRECQATDWSDQGQGHKIWCKLECGEEDTDWIIKELPDNQVGVFALRDFAKGSRIMVERGYSALEVKAHPKMKDLKPLAGTFEERFVENCTLTMGSEFVCFQANNFRHSCSPNSEKVESDNLKVITVVAERDIKAGEEIFVAYKNFRYILKYDKPEDLRHMLHYKDGVVCRPNCACRDPVKIEEVEKAKCKLRSHQDLVRQEKFEQAFKSAKDLIKYAEEIKLGFFEIANCR